MAKRIRFIDRDEELVWIIQTLLDTQQARALYIHADGGIGKTRLLQEVRTILRAPDYNALLSIPRNHTLKIAIVNEFCQTAWAEAFMRGVTETAANMEIDLLTTDARFDIEQMVQDLENVIQQSPDAIVVRLGSDPRLRPALQKASARGLKVVTLDNFLRELGSELTTRIVTQEDQSAILVAQQLVKDIQHHGDVVILTSKESAVQEKRRALFKRFMGAYSDVILHVEELPMDERMSERAYDRTLTLVREHPNLKAFWVTWDEFMPGVLHALREAGRADVGVYGFDAPSLAEFKTLATSDSAWRASVTVDPVAIGRSVVHLAAMAACDRPLQRYYGIPAQFYNKEMIHRAAETHPSLSLTDPVYLPNLVTLDIIDFDDQAFRDELVFALKLAGMIGEEHFDDFYRELQYLTELKTQEGISRFVLDKRRLDVERTFITCLKQIASEQSTVVILDTIEKAHEVIPFITDILKATSNIVMVMAGRPDEKSLKMLKDALGSRLDNRPLLPLNDKASLKYLQEKQASLHTILDESFKQNLLRLAAGKPILIELAVEWHARGRVLPWTTDEQSLAQQTAEAHPQPWTHEQDFESQLVRHIGQVKNLLDWVTLLLAYVYPLDMHTIGRLLDLTPQETQQAWDEVQDLVYIKHLPGERITLHDKMRELVNDYVWPDFDHDGSRRREISQAANAYLREQIEQHQAYIQHLAEDSKHAEQMLVTQASLESWREYQEYTEAVWLLREQLLQHLLVVDLPAGLQLFFDLYDTATKSYRYAARAGWIKMVEPYFDQLASKDQCEVLLCKAKVLLDDKQYVQAAQVLQDILTDKSPDPYQQADAHIQLANVVIRQGNLTRGIKEFELAVEISREAGAKQWLVKAENGLGWAYRLIADLDKARQHYESALHLAIEENLLYEQSMLYNNLGFLYAYRREMPDFLGKAQDLCGESLRLAKELDNQRGIGRAYSALGCVCFMGGEIERALENFELALQIFEPKGDEEWLSQVYAWRGATRMSGPRMDLTAAQNDLELARRINIPKDQPVILSRLALIYLIQGRLDEAENLVLECRQRAVELPDLWYQWVTIRDLARVARHRNAFSRLPELEQMTLEHLQKWPNVDKRAHGMLLLELGCLALGLSDHQKAVNNFVEGMRILISVGQYGGDRPVVFLQRIEEQFLHNNPNLSKAQIAAFGRDLLNSWKTGGLSILYPDVRHIYEHWANWQEAPDA